jgi:ribosomal protein L5
MIQGMDIAIVTTAKTEDETRYLLESLGIPFKKDIK